MNGGDIAAIVILAAFGVVGLLGGLRWLMQATVGLLAGCIVLVALSRAGAVPGFGAAGALVNDGRIAPALSRSADRIAQRLLPEEPGEPAAETMVAGQEPADDPKRLAAAP